MPLVILEGPNGGGKSTIARALNPSVLLKAGPPTKPTAYEEWVAPLVTLAPVVHDGQLVVCDRWHLGESVYPPILTPPRPRLCDDFELKLISRTLGGMMPTVIAFVLPPLETLVARFSARDNGTHWQVRLEQAKAAHARYLMMSSPFDRFPFADGCTQVILRSDNDVASFISEYGA